MGNARASIVMVYTPLGGEPISLATSIDTSMAWIETKALDIGPNFVYFIDQITSWISERNEQTNLQLEIYGSDTEDGEERYADDDGEGGNQFELLDTLDLARQDPAFTDPPGKRYYKLRWIDRAVKERWRLHGFAIFGEPGEEI